jgi:hypothetical protein
MNSIPLIINSQSIGRIGNSAVYEILGQEEVDKITELACSAIYPDKDFPSNPLGKFPFDRVDQIQTTLEQVYGSRAGNGLSERVGRACLKYCLRDYGYGLGVTSSAFRLLPLPRRVLVGFEALTPIINQLSDHKVSLEHDKKNTYIHIELCPDCGKKQLKSTGCAVMLGFLNETLDWISAGKCVLSEGRNCIVCSDNQCTKKFNLIPLI